MKKSIIKIKEKKKNCVQPEGYKNIYFIFHYTVNNSLKLQAVCYAIVWILWITKIYIRKKENRKRDKTGSRKFRKINFSIEKTNYFIERLKKNKKENFRPALKALN